MWTMTIPKMIPNSGIYAGVWDLLHPGHLFGLDWARQRCGHLTAAVNINPTVDNPHKQQPLEPVADRCARLSACIHVDDIVTYTGEAELEALYATGAYDVAFVSQEHRELFTPTHSAITVFVPRPSSHSSTFLREQYRTRQKRVVEFGCGPESFVNFHAGDIYLTCDPMLDVMRKSGQFIEPPDDVLAFLDNHGIADDNGEYPFLWKSRKGQLDFGSVWREDVTPPGHSVLQESDEDIEIHHVTCECLTLDDWLEGYANQGFLDSIDLMYVNMPLGSNHIMNAFSFRVKPQMLVLHSNEDPVMEIFTAQGYRIWHRRTPVILTYP